MYKKAPLFQAFHLTKAHVEGLSKLADCADLSEEQRSSNVDYGCPVIPVSRSFAIQGTLFQLIADDVGRIATYVKEIWENEKMLVDAKKAVEARPACCKRLGMLAQLAFFPKDTFRLASKAKRYENHYTTTVVNAVVGKLWFFSTR